MGTRDVKELDDFLSKSGGKITAGSFSDAAKFGEILVLAAKGNAARDALALAGAEN